MREPIDTDAFIESVVSTIPGFTGPDELISLFEMIYGLPDLTGHIVEIGSWCGRSSVVMGLAAKLIGSQVYCIDIFPTLEEWKRGEDGDWSIDNHRFGAYRTEHPIYNDTFQEHFRPVYKTEISLLKIFSRFIKLYDMEDTITVHKGNIETFSNLVGSDFRGKFAFIDGDHDYIGVTKDIRHIVQWLVPSGILCIDDVGGVFEAVTRAVDDNIRTDKFINAANLTRKLFAATRRKDEYKRSGTDCIGVK